MTALASSAGVQAAPIPRKLAPMSSRWVAAAVVLALVVGQSIVATARPLRDDRPDAMDALRGTQSSHVRGKLDSARPDQRRPQDWRLALAPPPQGPSLCQPDQVSIVETPHVPRVHLHEASLAAVARGPPAA